MVRGRLSAALALGAAVLGGLIAAPSVSAKVEPVTGCRVTLKAASESHGARLVSRCGFLQTQIRVNADSVIYDISPKPRLTGPTDREDTFHCANRDRPVASCRGHAGRDVRVGVYIETKDFSCDVGYRIHITGGTDCDPQPNCDEVGYAASRRFAQPRGC